MQKRIKDQQYPNKDLKHAEKIDIVIVVDMLLTGFDSKYLNTLYVDKNLKYHGLIQAFSRTNRVLNDTKPYGNVLDFRRQQDAVNDAIALFSGEKTDRAKEIWLVDPAPAVIGKLEKAVAVLDKFMASQGLPSAPEQVANLKGDAARSQFINLFKEVQRLKTQLDQYTDLTPENAASIAQVIPPDQLQAFRGVYLETAQRLKAQQDKGGGESGTVQQLNFELETAALQAFVDGIMQRMIFDGEKLSDLLAPLDLGWKARTQKELALMEDLTPLLHKLAQGREISGLNAYE